jgi:hypothetical protein
VGEPQTLHAVIAAGNEADRPEVVTTVAIPEEWLSKPERSHLIDGLQASIRPIALVVVGQLDPYEDPEIAEGLVEVITACSARLFLHRTDPGAAIEVLALGGAGASIGVTASLRHMVPPQRRAQKRRRRPPRQRALHVFVPGIDEFRDVSELETWFGDDAPECAIPNCCGRGLTSFSRDPSDTEVLAEHNVRGWLAVMEEVIACERSGRDVWLRAYRLRVQTAYDELRSSTGVRAIKPYGSAAVWPSIAT